MIPKFVLMPSEAGLGNQLFILAAAEAISRQHSRPVWLVVDNPSSIRKWGWGPSLFADLTIKISDSIFLALLVRFAVRLRKSPVFGRLLRKFVFVERINQETDIIQSKVANGCIVFSGYFQREEIASELLRFKLANRSSFCSIDHGHNVSKGMSTAIHVRRGDYRSDKRYGLLAPEFFYQALEKLKTENSGVSVFSDSETLLDEEFSHNFPWTFQKVESCSPVCEFIRLLEFDSIVISNSTFSWWAAFLRQERIGGVIAPTPWYRLENFGQLTAPRTSGKLEAIWVE